MAFHHLGHVAQANGHAVDRDARQVLRGGDGQDVLDAEPLIGGIDPAAGPGEGGIQEGQGRHPQGVAGRLDDLFQGHLLLLQLLGID